jgi:hypothetical protein
VLHLEIDDFRAVLPQGVDPQGEQLFLGISVESYGGLVGLDDVALQIDQQQRVAGVLGDQLITGLWRW